MVTRTTVRRRDVVRPSVIMAGLLVVVAAAVLDRTGLWGWASRDVVADPGTVLALVLLVLSGLVGLFGLARGRGWRVAASAGAVVASAGIGTTVVGAIGGGLPGPVRRGAGGRHARRPGRGAEPVGARGFRRPG